MADNTNNTQSVVTASQITTTDQNQFLSIFQNSWFMRILTSWIPGGVIIDVLNFIVNLIDTTEKAVAIQGAGVAKKSIVVSAAAQYIEQQYNLGWADWIVKWVVGELVDAIVYAKNTFGWSWLPTIVNG
jgi:hypothetical protein